MRKPSGYATAIGLMAALPASIIWAGSGTPLSFAQSGPPAIQSKVVPSGEKRQLAFFTSVNPDCSVNGDMSVRLSKQPAHGVVDIDRGLGYTNYGARDQRYVCNLMLKEGYQVNYSSQADFRGEDQFEVEFFSASGSYSVWRYAVTVK